MKDGSSNMYERMREIPLIDTHAHRFHPGREPDFGQIAGGYLPGPQQKHNARQTLAYGMVIQSLRRHFGMPTDATDAQVEQERHRRLQQAPQAYCTDLLASENVEVYCLEIGSPLRGKAFTTDEINRFNACIPAQNRRYIVRIERVVDDLLDEGVSFAEFAAMFHRRLDRQVLAEDAIALKSSIAYYGGLDIELTEPADAQKAHEALLARREDKLAEKRFYAYTLLLSVDVAVRHDIPIQVHTGMGGGAFLNFRTFSPVGMIDFLRDDRVLNRAKIVLLHGGHPYEAETSFLVGQFANVYSDFSGSAYLSSLRGEDHIRGLMERAPLNKLMYGSDGVAFPEMSWAAPAHFCRLLSRVLSSLVGDGFLSEARALEVARMMLHDNAEQCYTKLQRPGAKK